MILALASSKRLKFERRKRILYFLRNAGFSYDVKIDMTTHTIAFDCRTSTIYESSISKLSVSGVKWLEEKEFIRTIISKDYLLLLSASLSNDSTLTKTPEALAAHEDSLAYHITVKPMTRATLSSKKVPEIQEICDMMKIKRSGNKQLLIDRIIKKMIEDEQF